MTGARRGRVEREGCTEDVVFRPVGGCCDPATGDGETEGMGNFGVVNVEVRLDRVGDGEGVGVGYLSYSLSTRQLTGI